MEEIINTQTVPENTLANEPKFILKKKFCPATIPGIIAMLATFFIAGFNIICGISMIKFNFNDTWIYLEQGIVYAIQFVAILLLCIFMFAKLNKPFLSAPLFVTALCYAAHFVCTLFTVYDQEEFEAVFHNIDNPINYNNCTYTDYMITRISYWIFLAMLIFSFIAAAVYVILASNEKLNEKVRKLWFIPAVVSVLSVGMYIIYNVLYVLLFCVKSEYESQANVVSSVMSALMNLAIFVPQVITVVVLCKWIANPYKKVKKKAPKAPAPQPVMYVPVPQPVQMPVNAPVPENQVSEPTNNIELIRQYKELLDLGAITQEEFEEKKKELL